MVSPDLTSHLTSSTPLQESSAELKEIYPGEIFANPADFDPGIRQMLPHYDEILDVIVRCIPKSACYILELGCGTGELTLKLLSELAKNRETGPLQVVAVDYSPRMLEFACSKIEKAGYADQVTWIEADFGNLATLQVKLAPPEGFDVCVSSLAIHHLMDPMKLQLFEWIRQNLCTGGCFWNADPVLPEFPALAEPYKAVGEEWNTLQGTALEKIRDRFGKIITQGYSSQDQWATLWAQIEMLKSAKFESVAVPWKYYGLAVFGGFV